MRPAGAAESKQGSVMSSLAALSSQSASSQATASAVLSRGYWGSGAPDVKGIDQSVSDALNEANNAASAKNTHSMATVLKAQIDFLNKLTPEQLNATATWSLHNGSAEGEKAISWAEYKTQAEAMYGLQSKLESFEASGTELLRPGDPGWDKASAATREYAAVEVLTRNLGMQRKGALEAAQSYLSGLNQPKDSVSLSAAAVAAMVLDADTYEATRSEGAATLARSRGTMVSLSA